MEINPFKQKIGSIIFKKPFLQTYTGGWKQIVKNNGFSKKYSKDVSLKKSWRL